MSIILKNEISDLFLESCSLFSFEHQQASLKKDHEAFENWLAKNAHGEMKFLDNNHEVRKKPQLILENVETAIVFLFPYAYGHKIRKRLGTSILPLKVKNTNSLISKKLISKYVYGKDYHKSLKLKLKEYGNKLKEFLKIDFSYRPVVDSIPFFDRAHARESGLGFIGKNTMLIRPGLGSFFFVATLLTSLPTELLGEPVEKKHAINQLDCGSCTKCLDACPTQALESPYFLNANKCLSYLTIEHRDVIDDRFIPYLKSTLYGCDICQDVCPYNFVTIDSPRISQFATIHSPFEEITALDLATMTKVQYELWFGGTAATRAKYSGLVRNALYHLFASEHPNILELCQKALLSDEPLIQKTAKQILKLF